MPRNSNSRPLYSIVIAVGRRIDDVPALVKEYADSLAAQGLKFEIIVVLDGPKQGLMQSLGASGVPMRVVELSRPFGESAALSAGFAEASGDYILTLPAYYQVQPTELEKLIGAATEEDDMLIAVRWPHAGSALEHLRRSTFHGFLKLITGARYRDLGCGVRLFTSQLADEIPLYGDQHRFLPVMSLRRGFRVREIELAQSPLDRFRGRYRIREYVNGLIDVITIFFLMRFTKKPLRFFGTIGAAAVGLGMLVITVLIVQRLFFGVALADRPALLIVSLLIVLGTQIFALGLVGELIIFGHAGELKEYAIRKIHSQDESHNKIDASLKSADS